MLDIAFELIGEATSNSLLMFCFCNLIIVIILTGSSKPNSMDSQDYTVTTSVSFNTCNLASQDHDCVDDDEEERLSLTDASTISDEYEGKESSHCCVEDEDVDEEDEDEENEEEEEEENEYDDDDGHDETTEVDGEEEEEEDDDLRKRAEEFIAKVNNEWRHEKLRALNLVY